MAQAGSPVMAGFKNLMQRVAGNGPQQGNTGRTGQNGPSNQQTQQRQDPNQQRQDPNQQSGFDPTQFKFDPITGKPIKNGSSNNPETQDSPLNIYEGLWKEATGDTEVAPPFSIKPETIKGVADSLSFSGNLPEDLDLSEFTEGQRNSILALVDHVGRQSYSTSIDHASKLTDKWYGMRAAHDAKKLPGMVKDTLSFNNIDNMEVAQKNPIIKENMRMIGKQLRALHPEATPEWIAEQTKSFFGEMAKALNPDMFQQQQIQQQERERAPGGQDFDWNNWIDGNKQAA